MGIHLFGVTVTAEALRETKPSRQGQNDRAETIGNDSAVLVWRVWRRAKKRGSNESSLIHMLLYWNYTLNSMTDRRTDGQTDRRKDILKYNR